MDDGDVFCCNRVVSWLEQLAAERGVREDGGAVAAAARFGETEGVWRETRIEMEKKRGEDATLVRANPEALPHRPREDGLPHHADTSRSNIAVALLSRWRLSKPEGIEKGLKILHCQGVDSVSRGRFTDCTPSRHTL